MEQGIVTSVFYGSGVTTCHVQAVRTDVEYRHVPVAKLHGSEYTVPEVDQTVLMDTLADGERIIIGVLARNDDSAVPSSMNPGEVTFQFDAGTKISVAETAGGYTVTVTASDEVVIEGSEVTIDGMDFDQHVHDYDDDGTTKTTGAPKDGSA